MGSVQIRPLHKIEDFDAVIELQRKIWQYSDLEAESRGILTVASLFAGQVLGAFAGFQMVGFSLAFVGLEPGSLHSHRVGVLPTHQNAGVGLGLKLAQREHALKAGYDCIHWTFDPLQTRNAYFNLRRLGGFARKLFSNLYGTTSSPLHGGLPTDRLVLDWDLRSQRVISTLAGERPARTEKIQRIPLIDGDCDSMAVNQAKLRHRLHEAFSAGMTLTDFEVRGSAGDYILEMI